MTRDFVSAATFNMSASFGANLNIGGLWSKWNSILAVVSTLPGRFTSKPSNPSLFAVLCHSMISLSLYNSLSSCMNILLKKDDNFIFAVAGGMAPV